MSKLFQSCKIDRPMARSLDAIYRSGDDSVPVDGTLQYRFNKSMHTIKPGGRQVCAPARTVDVHPISRESSPFYMTGGTKRTHPTE